VFKFGCAEPENFGCGSGQVGDGVLVCRFRRFRRFTGSPCPPIFWARVVFWESMLGAEVSMAVGAFEG